MKLKDKVAVITGAGSGIGKATARLFAREGALVVCVDIDAQNGNQTTDEIQRDGQKALFLQADVSVSDDVRRVAARCQKEVKKVDILFNNAGRAIEAGFEATTEQTWSKMLDINLTGVFLCSKYLLPHLKAAGSGAIINHASIDAFLGNPRVAAYSAAKGGIIPLTHVMAYELGQYNIRVNCICTGGIATPLMLPDLPKKLSAVTPLRRMGTPEEVARVALFLASDDSAYVSGASIVVDGGRTTITQGTF